MRNLSLCSDKAYQFDEDFGGGVSQRFALCKAHEATADSSSRQSRGRKP